MRASQRNGGIRGFGASHDDLPDALTHLGIGASLIGEGRSVFDVFPGLAHAAPAYQKQGRRQTMSNSLPARFETLEQRMCLSAAPFAVSVAPGDAGPQLRIRGTPGDDQIIISQGSAGLTVADGGDWSATYRGTFSSILLRAGRGKDRIALDPSVTANAVIYGGKGGDTLIGGSGNDALYGGRGINQLNGNAGGDTLVSVGGSGIDQQTGGDGRDSFWLDGGPGEVVTDLSSAEQQAGNLHRVGGFLYPYALSGPSASSARANTLASSLPDPLLTDSRLRYQSFSDRPLFSSAGPAADDVAQGALGDCYYLATLSSIAKTDPNRIRQSIVNLGDDTYAVQFERGDSAVFIRVDADLPVWPGGSRAYADLGAQQSLWVALLEKAYAFFRYSDGNYASLSGGWMTEAYSALGASSTSTSRVSSAQALLQYVHGQLAAGRSVTYGVLNAPAGAPVVGRHAYSVDRVNLDASGNPISLRLRNPWGVDGAGFDGSDDGYVTLTPQQALAAFWAVISAKV